MGTGFGAGSRIAGYRLEERIGQGGMAVVFRARDERLKRPVALKILAPALADDAEFQRRFVSESRAAAAIDDPHIVPVFAAGEADGVLFIAMRYVGGGDARLLLEREGPLAAGRVAAVISPVASALDAAHRAGLVHRDVKPSNMLVDVLAGRPDHVYLSDFGVSKSLAAGPGVTAAGVVLGTLAYMSPEQAGERPADGRADQYALACSAFELLAGAPPFGGDEPAAVMYAHLREAPPSLSSRRPGLPVAVDGVLSRALAKAPEDRYASCGEFADALRDAFGLPPFGSGPGAWPQVQAGQARPRRRLRRPIVVAALILAAAGVTAGLLVGSGAPTPTVPPVTVPISLKSALPAVTGDVYVDYLGGDQANAEVSGEITKAANGDVAELYAQPFPYKNAPARVRSVTLHPAGTTARYQFQVTPTLATHYRVELFQRGTSTTPIGISGMATVYVSLGSTSNDEQNCERPVCYESMKTIFAGPPSALPTEMAKTLYVYFGLNLAFKAPPAPPAKTPPTPQWLTLGAGNGVVISTKRISAYAFTETVTYSFGVGDDAYNWNWDTCLKDTVAEDGIGLPGHHGCGDNRVFDPSDGSGYLG